MAPPKSNYEGPAAPAPAYWGLDPDTTSGHATILSSMQLRRAREEIGLAQVALCRWQGLSSSSNWFPLTDAIARIHSHGTGVR